MSNEPGLTLGRLIAAERNALAAINTLKALEKRLAGYEQQLTQIRAENVQLSQRINALQLQIVAGMGNGSTVK